MATFLGYRLDIKHGKILKDAVPVAIALIIMMIMLLSPLCQDHMRFDAVCCPGIIAMPGFVCLPFMTSIWIHDQDEHRDHE
jgi:hypothetical protein